MSNSEEQSILFENKIVREGGENADANIIQNIQSNPGAESALQNGTTAPQTAVNPGLLTGGVAISSFTFKSPFIAPKSPEKVSGEPNSNAPRPSSLPASSSDHQPSATPAQLRLDAITVAKSISTLPISQMTAKDLAQVVASRIPNFETELWIAEDISGAALIGSVAPSCLADLLTQVLFIKSQFIKSRIQQHIIDLVTKDLSIESSVRGEWEQLRAVATPFLNPQRAAALPTQQFSPSTPQILFPTPSFGATRALHSATPSAIFGGRTTYENSLNRSVPSFLRECGSPDDFSLEDTSLFANTTRASVSNSNISGAHMLAGGGMSITINQPSATPPKYIILECASDPVAFYNWIRKNRKESLLALPVDRRTLSQLVGEDVKDEVARILKALGPSNSFYFNAETSPYPRNWPEVSDHLLLKILFSINGPRSAHEAKSRLKQRLFWFKDSTTSQDKLTPKLRKFCNEFKNNLKDFAYTHHLWAENDILEHNMVVEAFSDCFANTEQIKGPSGTMVPMSVNYAKIREMIRERKQLPLEEIIHFIIESFERVDIQVRGCKSINYDTKPWNDDDSRKGRKRNVNQISGGKTQENNAKKPPRPPAAFPRCANCGRKSHACGERTCHLFGHAKGRGEKGVWADGEASLWLDPAEQKAWKIVRDTVFYSYPENQKEKTQKKPQGA
jgi:hypothetical protein